MTGTYPSMSHYRVKFEGTLLEALEHMFAGRSRRDLRRLLREQRIKVNGRPVSSLRAGVREGDNIDCVRSGVPRPLHSKVRLIYEDDEVIVVDKDTGILTEGGIRGGPTTVLRVLNEYLRERGVTGSAYPCHRLDRDVSGLLLFARRRKLAGSVREDPRRYLPERIYYAMVEGTPDPREGTLRSYLQDDKDQVVRVTTEARGGKLAVCHYRVVESDERYSIAEIRLETGRRNQIRVQMSGIGHPVVGDRKYGARTDVLHRLGLHARRLVFVHPVSGERLEFGSPPPFGLPGRGSLRKKG